MKHLFAPAEQHITGHNITRLLDNIDHQLKKATFLKDDATCSVYRLQYDHLDLVIKRYNIKSWKHFLSRCYRPSRAYRCWQACHFLKQAGIKTIKPIAYKEKRFFGLRHRAYFIYEYLPANLLSETLISTSQTSLIQQVLNIFQALKKHQISHGDMKATNWLIDKAGDIALIDLDATKQRPSKKQFQKAFKKDKARFLKNWKDNPELFDFFKSSIAA